MLKLSLPQQAVALRTYFPSGHVRLTRDRLSWQASLRPTLTTRSYGLRLEAVAHREPRLWVTEPALVPDSSGRLPHIYEDGSLCVARATDWRPDQLFVDSFVPWAALWLFHYELWRATGAWLGDGPDTQGPEAQAALLHPYRGTSGHNFQWIGTRR